MDKASPKLALACAAGTHIGTVVVELCRAGGDKVRFMQYKFTNCMISSFTTSADNDFPEDEVAFIYGKVQWCYTRQQRAAGWSLERNCKC